MDQIAFFESVKKMRGETRSSDLKHLVARILNISLSGAYKKINSITQLSIGEADKILDHLDAKMEIKRAHSEYKQTYSFISDDVIEPPRSYEQWIANVLNHSQELERLRQSYKLYSFQSEISYFHLLAFKPLLYFKLFVWNKSNWNIPDGKKFRSDPFKSNLALNLMIDQLNKHYLSYDGIDIWNYDFLDPLLHQISYYYKMGAIPDNGDMEDIVKSVRKLLESLDKSSELGHKHVLGKKEMNGRLTIYLNQTATNSNVLFIDSGQFRFTYGAFLHPNYLRTMDKHICDATIKWMKQTIQQSTLISGTGEQARRAYFNNLQEKVLSFESSIGL